MKADFSGLRRLSERFKAIGEERYDARPLLFTWMRLAEDGNRAGVLAGTDGEGNPMVPVTYRPKAITKNDWHLTSADARKRQRNGARQTARRGVFSSFGPAAAGLHNNLTRREYQLLDGPPLAPRKQFSRVITNFVTRFVDDSPAGREIECGWLGVVSAKGVAFLGAHFNGLVKKGIRLPKRDLRGIRPETREKMQRSLVNWMRDIVRTLGTNRAA